MVLQLERQYLEQLVVLHRERRHLERMVLQLERRYLEQPVVLHQLQRLYQ